LDHDTVRVEVERETRLQVPLHHLGGLVCFGDTLVSPALLGRCAQDGRGVAFLSRSGRFLYRVEGPVSGNVLLRRAQHHALDRPERVAAVARAVVAAKLRNCRENLLRAARDSVAAADITSLRGVADTHADLLRRLEQTSDLERLRGYEGEAAHAYFGVFDRMVRSDLRPDFTMAGRTRRPPRDRMNALLSFLYTLVAHDCASALQGVGLDPQLGCLHALRPGRPALALDLAEEFRPILADRLALTLVNRRQITSKDLVEREGGSWQLKDDPRKELIVAYQKRKQDEAPHPALKEKVPLGLVPHVQARLLARHLRGELETYPPFLYR
jgi:CRISPR-associated protein Cas1